MTRAVIDRRNLLLSTLAVGGLAATSGASWAQSAEKIVKVGLSGGGSWRDSVEKQVAPRLTPQGAKIEFIIDAPQGNIAKIFAARGGPAPFDVLESGPNLIQVAERGVAALDYSKMPNSAALPAYMKGKDYVWNCASQDGIVYNTEIFKANDIPLPKTYKDLAHPKLKGKVAMPDVNHVQHWNAVVGMAHDNGGTEATLEKAIPVINEIRPSYFYASSTDLGQKMASGEIWAAAWHAGWAVRLRKSGVPVATIFPEIGSKKGALWPVILQLTKTAPQPDLGLAFINLYIDPEVQAAHAQTTGVMPAHPAALKAFAEDPVVRELMLVEPAQIDNLYVVDFTKIDQAKWRDSWNKEIQR